MFTALFRGGCPFVITFLCLFLNLQKQLRCLYIRDYENRVFILNQTRKSLGVNPACRLNQEGIKAMTNKRTDAFFSFPTRRKESVLTCVYIHQVPNKVLCVCVCVCVCVCCHPIYSGRQVMERPADGLWIHLAVHRQRHRICC